MSSSRNRAFPLEIYQDPQPPYEQQNQQYYGYHQHHHLQPQYQPLEPAHDLINHVYYPAHMPPQHPQLSPLKHASASSSPHLDVGDAALFDAVAFPAPPNHTVADSPLKRHYDSSSLQQQQQQQQLPGQKPQKGFFATFASFKTMDKENVYPQPVIGDFTLKSDIPGSRSMLGKRSADSFDLGQSLAPGKRQKLDADADADAPLPEPTEMPHVPDEGGKPPYSYAQLIGMAILRAPNRRLTLAQIYKWISDTFSFYREGESGWTNSIRHNLSLNKAFVKRERPKDDPGKGNYWAIETGMEKQFLKESAKLRRSTNSDMSSQPGLSSDAVRPPTSSGNALVVEPAPGVATSTAAVTAAAAAAAAPPVTATTTATRRLNRLSSSKAPVPHDISSDATQPVSEDINQDEKLADPSLMRSSPPPSLPPQPDHLRSSPPLAPSRVTKGTPRRHRPSSSIDRKKQSDAYRDSGFYSSLESSATRPPRAAHSSLALDAAAAATEHERRPRSKRSGRAEDEIARMRGSSFDPSPPKPKAVFKQPGLPASQMLSSPLRPRDSIPLTPGLKLRPTKTQLLKPPPTVSPNTHLRKHRESVRELVGTPGQRLGQLLANDEFKNSPAFFLNTEFSPWKLGQDLPGPSPLKRSLQDFDDGLSVWANNAEDLAGFYDSPLKRSSAKAARPLLQRSHTVNGLPGDMHAPTSEFRLASPIRLFPHLDDDAAAAAVEIESPTKKGSSQRVEPLPDLNITAADLWGADSTDSDEELCGMDMTQGFRSIGVPASMPSATGGTNKENQHCERPPEKAKFAPVKTSRPPLGRSSTNIF